MSNRVVTKKGYNIPAHQQEDYVVAKTETIVIPSSSAPGWGSYFTIDYREMNTVLQELTLQYNLSSLTGTTSVRFLPAWYFFSRCELVQNGKVIDTLYPNEQFIRNQLYCYDEDRVFKNCGAGSYSSTTQRGALAGAASAYYVPLLTYFNQGNAIPIVHQGHFLQLSIYMDNLVNVTAPAGAPINTILSVNLLAKVVRLRAEEVQAKMSQLTKRPQHFRFSELRPMSVTVLSGVSSTNIVLTGIVGRISHLIFCVRPSASLVNDSAFSYVAIKDFSVLDASSTNISGGVVIPHSEAMFLLNRE